MQEKKALSSRGRGRLRGFLELRRPWGFSPARTAVRQASLSITNSWSLLKLMSIESVMPSNHLILFCSYLESFPASVLPVTIQD